MSTLEIVEAGPYTSVQDRGRFGGQRYGLGPAGAMDGLSLAVANALVGQPVGAAAIEIGPLQAKFKAVGGDIRLALAGAVRAVSVQGRGILAHETFVLAEGEVVALRGAAQGVFSYLAVEGGIKAPAVFGSLSMHARSAIGSPYRRALAAGDRLEVGDAGAWTAEHNIVPPRREDGPLRVVLGPQDDHFTEAGLATLLTGSWTISPTSDRMGYRLEGPKLEHGRGHNIISDGIAFGSVQIPGNGQPLILMADRGTTGGYPKIATIVTPDLGRLAQMPVGACVRFSVVSIADAQQMVEKYIHGINCLGGSVRAVGGGSLSSEFLLSVNLAGHVTDAHD